jgi:phosphoribosylformimino-5-aminoimidazole carboxamide ribotide isomerase
VIIIPAVDIRGGKCVRLREGRADAETVFSSDPIAVALRWVRSGAQRLHVVDLDGAFGGVPRQTGLVTDIVRAVAPVPVEVGGGLRGLAAVEAVLASGAGWAVVGTRAITDATFLAEVCRAFPDRVIVAVDGRGSCVAINGWTETAAESVIDVARRAQDAGAAAVLYTDIARDGTETGPNLEQTGALARAVSLPVLASGGVGGLDDLERLAQLPGLAGVVVGRALYTGAVNLGWAIQRIERRAVAPGC